MLDDLDLSAYITTPLSDDEIAELRSRCDRPIFDPIVVAAGIVWGSGPCCNETPVRMTMDAVRTRTEIVTERFDKYREHIDPECRRWGKTYPQFPGVAECVRLILAGKAKGSWADIIAAELAAHAAQRLDELIAAYRENSDSDVRLYVLMALEMALVPESVPFLVDVLRESDLRLVEYARRTLAEIDTRDARAAKFAMRDEDFRIDIGRSSAGDFMRMIHLPTGIERVHPGPLLGVDRSELRRRWRAEIEAEIRKHQPRKPKQ